MGLSIDRDKIIKGLECCQYSSKSHCDGCPYVYESLCNTNDCTADLASDVLSLLKEQEPKLVRIDEDSVYCPSGGNELFTYPRQKFCDECGQAVKWE